ncbi:MAG: LysR family transcriptional regulator [Rhodovulum sulfidophilum]|uniref:LysR family transcriptional regulator n=1 Tax=Rhodovulum sulfidophilum TaxID=35806 RepID=A0A2W5NAS5_RHOSU|nr:MAG: LysR family transcriptional regulator [Rhodovulum sulfidophilum]
MDLRSLECFLTLAELLNFRRAAERANLTQPALSHRIRALEDGLGVRLFERDRRGEAGRLRLGFTVIAFHGALPESVRAFREASPRVEVELVERDSPGLEAALVAEEIDLAVLHPPLETAGLGGVDLPDLRLVLALPERHPLAERDEIDLADLDGEALLLAPRRVGPRFHDRLWQSLSAARARPRVAQEVMPMTTLAGLVAAGAGVGFVTEGIAAIGRPGVVFRPCRPEPPRLPLAFAWRGDQPDPVAARFVALARARLEAPGET